MLDLDIEDENGEIFNQNLIENETPLIPNPTVIEPFQLIHEYTLEDASYLFNYFNVEAHHRNYPYSKESTTTNAFKLARERLTA